jgi:CrcB protein
MPYLIVFIGGGFGSLLRHGVNVLGARWLGTGFPYHTLAVNITGSFLMGLVAGYFAF